MSDLFDIRNYSNDDLYKILDFHVSPTRSELAAKLQFFLQKYSSPSSSSSAEEYSLGGLYRSIYAHFFPEDEPPVHEPFSQLDGGSGSGSGSGSGGSSGGIASEVVVVDGGGGAQKPELTQALSYAKGTLNPLIKETVQRIINVDSKYRDKNIYPYSTNFSFPLSETLNNVVSLKLYSVNIPYAWYNVGNNFGANFFYIRSSLPGIDNAANLYKLSVQPAYYTSLADLLGQINKSFDAVVASNPDVQFNSGAGAGAASFVQFNENSSVNRNAHVDLNVQISKKYGAMNYQLDWPSNEPSYFSPDTADRTLSMRSFLGFYEYTYPLYTIYSTSFQADPTQNAIWRYSSSAAGMQFTVFFYIPQNPSTTEFHSPENADPVTGAPLSYASIVINLCDFAAAFQATGAAGAGLYSAQYYVQLINYAFSQTPGLYASPDNGSQVAVQYINHPNMSPFYRFAWSIYLNRPRLPSNFFRTNMKACIVFPDPGVDVTPDSTFYGNLWTGPTSCFQMNSDPAFNELDTVFGETSYDQSPYFIVNDPYFYFKCRKPGFGDYGTWIYTQDGYSFTASASSPQYNPMVLVVNPSNTPFTFSTTLDPRYVGNNTALANLVNADIAAGFTSPTSFQISPLDPSQQYRISANAPILISSSSSSSSSSNILSQDLTIQGGTFAKLVHNVPSSSFTLPVSTKTASYIGIPANTTLFGNSVTVQLGGQGSSSVIMSIPLSSPSPSSPSSSPPSASFSFSSSQSITISSSSPSAFFQLFGDVYFDNPSPSSNIPIQTNAVKTSISASNYTISNANSLAFDFSANAQFSFRNTHTNVTVTAFLTSSSSSSSSSSPPINVNIIFPTYAQNTFVDANNTPIPLFSVTSSSSSADGTQSSTVYDISSFGASASYTLAVNQNDSISFIAPFSFLLGFVNDSPNIAFQGDWDSFDPISSSLTSILPNSAFTLSSPDATFSLLQQTAYSADYCTLFSNSINLRGLYPINLCSPVDNTISVQPSSSSSSAPPCILTILCPTLSRCITFNTENLSVSGNFNVVVPAGSSSSSSCSFYHGPTSSYTVTLNGGCVIETESFPAIHAICSGSGGAGSSPDLFSLRGDYTSVASTNILMAGISTVDGTAFTVKGNISVVKYHQHCDFRTKSIPSSSTIPYNILSYLAVLNDNLSMTNLHSAISSYSDNILRSSSTLSVGVNMEVDSNNESVSLQRGGQQGLTTLGDNSMQLYPENISFTLDFSKMALFDNEISSPATSQKLVSLRNALLTPFTFTTGPFTGGTTGIPVPTLSSTSTQQLSLAVVELTNLTSWWKTNPQISAFQTVFPVTACPTPTPPLLYNHTTVSDTAVSVYIIDLQTTLLAFIAQSVAGYMNGIFSLSPSSSITIAKASSVSTASSYYYTFTFNIGISFSLSNDDFDIYMSDVNNSPTTPSPPASTSWTTSIWNLYLSFLNAPLLSTSTSLPASAVIQSDKVIVDTVDNSTIYLDARYERTGGVYAANSQAYTASAPPPYHQIAIPLLNNNTTTTTSALTVLALQQNINSIFASNPITNGSVLSFSGNYTKLRMNINFAFQTTDYYIEFYDPIQFSQSQTSSSSSVSSSSSSSVSSSSSSSSMSSSSSSSIYQNILWDSTMGWLLGFRGSYTYRLNPDTNSYAAFTPNNSPISYYVDATTNTNTTTQFQYNPATSCATITSDTVVTMNIYSYFMIVLDDYSQNHLNDGIVSIGYQDSILTTVPSYGSIYQASPADNATKFVGQYTSNDPSQNNLTKKQMYAANQIFAAKQNNTQRSYTTNDIFLTDVFGIIPLKLGGSPGDIYTEFGGTLQLQSRFYLGPVNLRKMTIKLLNDKGEFVDFNGQDWSFSLTCEQLYQPSI